jgi:hypothetical protein
LPFETLSALSKPLAQALLEASFGSATPVAQVMTRSLIDARHALLLPGAARALS